MLDGSVISLCLIVLRQGGRTFAPAFWRSMLEGALARPVRSKGPPPLNDACVVGADLQHFLQHCAFLFAYLIEREFDISKLIFSAQVVQLS